MGMIIWKPIETAPKDGTVILLRGGVIGEVSIYEGLYRNRPVTAFWVEDLWCVAIFDQTFYTSCEEPVEWCEVPD